MNTKFYLKATEYILVDKEHLKKGSWVLKVVWGCGLFYILYNKIEKLSNLIKALKLKFKY